MSRFGNYQIAVNNLSYIIRFKDRIKNTKNIFRKIRLRMLLNKKLKQLWQTL